MVNVVPDYSRIWVRVRDTKREGMNEVYEHVKKMAEGAAIMANVDYEINLISGIHFLTALIAANTSSDIKRL